MPQLLFELGCEELPAGFVRGAYEQLEREVLSRLSEAGLQPGTSTSMGTPRRLIVAVEDVQDRQPDSEKELRGPSLKVAYDAEGKPSPALLGFCRSQGVDPAALAREGDYVIARKHIAGRPAFEVLAELLPAAVRALSFEKAMRWGAGRMRFARPIRWLLASFGGRIVEFELEGVRSGLRSRGHRFYSPDGFEATDLQSLLAGLRAASVEPDPSKREAQIVEGATAVSSGSPDLSPDLVEENVFLTEWPSALEGEFPAEYLQLPEPVLVTAMAKHERFFPVRGPSGELLNRFISIRNGGQDEAVRKGNAWVLSARFNDARFFFEEDQKHRLEDFLERTAGMSFQESLGTVRQRADRLAELSAFVAGWAGGDVDSVENARLAGLYCKADLSCGLVSELPSLQGLIGAEYARREQMHERVVQAIASQYAPDSPGANALESFAVILADALDKLAGYLGVGLVPSGSSDPYGLRRACTTLIEACWRWRGSLPSLEPLFHQALRAYDGQGFSLDAGGAEAQLVEIMRSRYQPAFGSPRHEWLQAALSHPYLAVELSPRVVRYRYECMSLCTGDDDFIQTCTRPLNIVSAARRKNEPMDHLSYEPDLLGGDTGLKLHGALEEVEEPAQRAAGSEDAAGLIARLRGLQEPINEFFEATMVMSEDPAERQARLSLLDRLCRILLLAGDFSQ